LRIEATESLPAQTENYIANRISGILDDTCENHGEYFLSMDGCCGNYVRARSDI